jgi:amphi-Trp domain-containing protein
LNGARRRARTEGGPEIGGHVTDTTRDVERIYSTPEVVAKLRRLADALEQGKTFDIQVAGERVRVPPRATVEFEYQREGDDEELEIEVKWTRR